MPTYVALLRGINVSGQKAIKMADLRHTFERIKCHNVQTYVQSGNVVFHSTTASAAALVKKIEAAIAHDYGFDVSVILRTAQELRAVVTKNPFVAQHGVDPSTLHITFLSATPSKDALKKLDVVPSAPDQFRIIGQQIYLHCPNGYGKTKLSNSAFERWLSVPATTRNWKTVNALVAMGTTADPE